MLHDSGLITITGGKWTTYRQMATDAVNKAVQTGALAAKASQTEDLKLHGYTNENIAGPLCVYGSDAAAIEALMKKEPLLHRPLAEGFPYTLAEVVWAVKNEMARTVEDVLARRLRLLFLDARKAVEAAPLVASMLRKELGRTEQWEQEQVRCFTELARPYCLSH